MAAPTGNKFAKNQGRKAGVPNKATANARDAIASFVDGNAERLTGWLDKMAKDNPEAAFKAFMSVVEYHIPKLARTEQVGDPDKPIEHKVTVTVVKPKS